jgi:hypothetical protein
MDGGNADCIGWRAGPRPPTGHGSARYRSQADFPFPISVRGVSRDLPIYPPSIEAHTYKSKLCALLARNSRNRGALEGTVKSPKKGASGRFLERKEPLAWLSPSR